MNFRNPYVTEEIVNGIEQFMMQYGYESLADMRI